jgi:hypothetical protein
MPTARQEGTPFIYGSRARQELSIQSIVSWGIPARTSVYAAQRLQRGHHRCESPVAHCAFERPPQLRPALLNHGFQEIVALGVTQV